VIAFQTVEQVPVDRRAAFPLSRTGNAGGGVRSRSLDGRVTLPGTLSAKARGASGRCAAPCAGGVPEPVGFAPAGLGPPDTVVSRMLSYLDGNALRSGMPLS
jgi:hypothetical protein